MHNIVDEIALFWAKFDYFGRKTTTMDIYQSQNWAKLDRFFTQKSPILYFLALTTFFSVLMVVFGQPLSLLNYTSQTSGINPHIQIAATAVAGLTIIILSRILLYLYAHRRDITAMGCLLWLLVELITTIAILCLTIWQISGGGHLSLAPLAGDFTMGVLVIEALPYLITYLAYRLNEERMEVQRLQDELERLQGHEPLIAGPLNDRTINFYDKSKHLAFSTASTNILYIESADNYVNIHYLNEGREETFILHNTLKEIENRLASTTIIRCHRSYIVNIENVKLLRKEAGALLLELNGGAKTIPVTKTYAADITARLAPDRN